MNMDDLHPTPHTAVPATWVLAVRCAACRALEKPQKYLSYTCGFVLHMLKHFANIAQPCRKLWLGPSDRGTGVLHPWSCCVISSCDNDVHNLLDQLMANIEPTVMLTV